jgi:hypothetical protein
MIGVWVPRAVAFAVAIAATFALVWQFRTPQPDFQARKQTVVYVHVIQRTCWDGKVHPEGCPF